MKDKKDIVLTDEVINEMKSIHFIADVHHGHVKIIDICNRPIKVEEHLLKNIKEEERNLSNEQYRRLVNETHNNWLVKEVINKYVGKKDNIYFLGDVSLAKKGDAERFIDRLNGRKFLILGNHDKNIQTSTRFEQITQIKDFTFSRYGLNIHIALCHYPLYSWNRKVYGSWHLYGHVHGRLKMPNVLALDVGLDNIEELFEITKGVYRPINLYEVYMFMKEKEQIIGEENSRKDYD